MTLLNLTQTVQSYSKSNTYTEKLCRTSILKTVAFLLGPSVKLAVDVIRKFEILRCKEIKTRLYSKKN